MTRFTQCADLKIYQTQRSDRLIVNGNEKKHDDNDCIYYSAFSRGNRQDLSSTDPSFTMRRKMEHLREEMEQIGLLRQVRIPL